METCVYRNQTVHIHTPADDDGLNKPTTGEDSHFNQWERKTFLYRMPENVSCLKGQLTPVKSSFMWF